MTEADVHAVAPPEPPSMNGPDGGALKPEQALGGAVNGGDGAQQALGDEPTAPAGEMAQP